MMVDKRLNELRAQANVPGERHDAMFFFCHLIKVVSTSGSVPVLGDSESRVPVILIHKPAATHSATDNYGSGWDLIVPAGWAMPFHIGMVYRGARVCGLRELENSDFEMFQSNFPLMYPDTAAGKVENENMREELERKHKRKPPAKRVNFEKLGVLCPHHNPWSRLTCDWSAEADGVSTPVLRDTSKLRDIQQCLDSKRLLSTSATRSNHLIPVRIDTLSRGCCDSLSLICIPSADDVEQLQRDSEFGGPKERVHSKTMADTQSFRDHCDRTVIGFVSVGKFSFRVGRGVGLGFVVFEALRRLQRESVWVNNRLLVLVRSQTSFQYRFVRLSILY